MEYGWITDGVRTFGVSLFSSSARANECIYGEKDLIRFSIGFYAVFDDFRIDYSFPEREQNIH